MVRISHSKVYRGARHFLIELFFSAETVGSSRLQEEIIHWVKGNPQDQADTVLPIYIFKRLQWQPQKTQE